MRMPVGHKAANGPTSSTAEQCEDGLTGLLGKGALTKRQDVSRNLT